MLHTMALFGVVLHLLHVIQSDDLEVGMPFAVDTYQAVIPTEMVPR